MESNSENETSSTSTSSEEIDVEILKAEKQLRKLKKKRKLKRKRKSKQVHLKKNVHDDASKTPSIGCFPKRIKKECVDVVVISDDERNDQNYEKVSHATDVDKVSESCLLKGIKKERGDVVVISDNETNDQKSENMSNATDTSDNFEKKIAPSILVPDGTYVYMEGSTRRLDQSKVFETLLCPEWSKVSESQPYRIQQNATFLVDVQGSDPIMMIRNLESDDNGAYICKGTRTSTWKVEENFEDFEVQEYRMLSKTKQKLETLDQYHLIRKYRRFTSCDDFNKIISYFVNSRGEVLNHVALVQYYFESGVERPFVVKRHGNAVNTSAPYKSTNASTKAIAREQLKVDKPKSVHHNLTKM